MTKTNANTSLPIISGIPGAHPPGATHRGRSRRAPMSPEQRRKLSLTQKAYVASDPRWAEHRRKLADAQIARRMTLTQEELNAVLAMRARGRTFSYIQEEIGVCHDVIRRELAERGYPTGRTRRERRAKRGKGTGVPSTEPAAPRNGLALRRKASLENSDVP